MTDIDDLLATARSRRIDFKQGAHLLPRDMVLIVKLEAALRDARAEVERLQTENEQLRGDLHYLAEYTTDLHEAMPEPATNSENVTVGPIAVSPAPTEESGG